MLPKRGEKDFEPNPTLFQADVLSASRQAMHNALSYPRLHFHKHKVVGFYAPEGPAPPPGNEESGVEAGVPPDSCVYVTHPKGQYFRTMGKGDRWNRIWLLPEEALYLLERGTLDIRWPLSLIGADDDDGEEEPLPMSLQAAYACLLGRAGLTPERFSVYTGLRRLGYTLVRAPTWNEEDVPSEKTAGIVDDDDGGKKPDRGFSGLTSRLFQLIYNSSSIASTAVGPVVGLGIHQSYSESFSEQDGEPSNNTFADDIFQRLGLIPFYDPTESPVQQDTTPPFRIAFHVYKPSTPFRKSAPPEPDFRIAVINSRTQTSIPTSSQLGALLDNTPFHPPRGEKLDRQLYLRLRHGYRNVILAIVDQGVVSYLRIADSAFGKERIYENRTGPKSKQSRKGHQRHGPNG